jgi:hypothetical protein
MPQFDFFSFSGQNFWFLVSFFSFYFLFYFYYLSTFSELLKMRNKLILLYTNILDLNKKKQLNLFDYFFFKIF